MLNKKRLRLGVVAACASASVVFVGGTTVGSAAGTSLVKPGGFVVSQHAKGSPLCALPRVCYSPALLQRAYDFPTGWRAPTGAGQTIMIVVPYGSPTINADLATFDATFNVPAPRSFTTVTGAGAGGTGSGDLPDWSVEASASVEYAHAMAPGANIVLAISPTDDLVDIVATEAQLLPLYPGAIVSQSFGDDETDPDPTAAVAFQQLHNIYAAATSAGGTVLASVGDFGASDGGDTPVASYPASDPLVTAVGGTEGNPYPGGLLKPFGGYGGEQVWNESDEFGLAGGGAPSVLFPTPTYQQGVTGYSDARTVPDVSYNAAINGGIQFCDSDPNVGIPGCFATFGGTSAGAPQWAAITALADEVRANARQGRIGVLNTALYAIAKNPRTYREDFHDITVGTNALTVTNDDGSTTTLPGFNAGRGYDLASGLGTPDVANLIGDLVLTPFDQHFHGYGPRYPFGFKGFGGQHHHMRPDR
jgi:subtilase family serine protease